MPNKTPKWMQIDVRQMQKEYDRLLDELREIEEFADRLGLPLNRRQPEGTDTSGTLPGMTVRDAAHAILVEHGEPMHLSELYQRLKQAGVEIRGKNEKNTLFATIRGDDRFINLGRNTWDLKERQTEDGSGEETEQ